MRQLISLKEAMDILTIGNTKIRQIACTDPTFPAYLIGGRWKVDAKKLDEWIEAQRVGAGALKRVESYTPAKRGRPPAKTQPKQWQAITPGWSRPS